MQQKIKIQPITAELYPSYYEMVQASQWGNPMLPTVYQSSLWGDVLMEDDKVIGGWVGTIRGNIPLMRMITKSVYFDAYPVFKSVKKEKQYASDFMAAVKQHAQREDIVMLNLTHWVRKGYLEIDKINLMASFVVNLAQEEDILFKNMDSAKQRNVKKASKFALDILICKGEESIKYLDDFQRLRENTQNRAISKNKQTSMLLKSNEFFKNLMLQPNAILLLGKHEGIVVSVALMLKGGNAIYYHSGGSDIDINRKTCCSAYMFWKALLHFKNEGIKLFDFGGCPICPSEDHPAYGVYRFKKGFGGEYMEFEGGQIIITSWKYRLLQWILSQRKLLRFFSTKL